MAYQTRGRDPLFDTDTAATLERRGRELCGIVLLGLGLLAGAMIASYAPDDPSWLSATDAPVQNWTGRPGAAIAAPLFMIIGWGAWAFAAVPLVWGLRLVAHQGEGRLIGRIVFAPIWVALCSVYASGLAAGESWTHSFGLGGLFGDMMMGSILTALPVAPGLGLKLMQAVAGLAIVGFGAFVLGFTRTELRSIAHFLALGVVMSYATLMRLLGVGAAGAVAGAQRLHAAQADRRARRGEPGRGAAYDPRDAYGNDDAPEPEPRSGFLSRMPGLVRRPALADEMPEPELIERDMDDVEIDEPGEERVRARISDAIRTRLNGVTRGTMRPDPSKPLTGGRGRGPQPLIVSPRVVAEPPLTAGAVPPPPPPAEGNATWTDDAAWDAMPDEYADPYGDEDEAELLTDDRPAPVSPRRPVTLDRKVVQQPARTPIQPSRRAQEEAQPSLQFDDGSTAFELPPLSLLMNPEKIERHILSDEALEENARMLETVLDDYGVKGEIVSVRPGPVVTMYELEPAPGLKASRVIGLADDIARSMSALSARVSTVPGRSVIGIELPNEKREMVGFREILASRDYGDGKHGLPLALGKNIGGEPMVANLAKMPHLLIAGTTGSGKSVAINTMILSLLYKLTPDELRLVMIDPKMLELSVYDGIPHLLSPVVTDPKKAVVALKWVVGEMEDRYRKMSKMGVRNIDGYNSRVADALGRGEMFSRTVQTGFDDETGEPVFETEEFEPKKMPYIVVIVDEMADLMMVAGKEIEACIQRLAQMARASGIHLIMATQRPSVDVITGTIKANFPTRISFQVTSKIDSRTILGEMGAEQLLGMGDMLYMAGGARITRCHGPFVSDEEVEEIVNHLKSFGAPDYVGGVVEGPDDDKSSDIDAVLGLNTGGNTGGEDALYDQAVAIVIKDRKCSTSYIQRKLGIGYNKAARLVEQMEDQSVVSSANHVGKREILVPEQ
ncbi:DNA translocase FtsK [Citreimonas salinaria]|uniref:DNA translocase FtsK n=1 Tax=Citreimonas salinaria TaxID=321339 RepID=A0A1H3HLN9_9RHOB|nr:DNA translocase FtsK [Citreimonas salinaria]SDY16446.1 DNA translocase FtsK [Citreimonas salinaria]